MAGPLQLLPLFLCSCYCGPNWLPAAAACTVVAVYLVHSSAWPVADQPTTTHMLSAVGQGGAPIVGCCMGRWQCMYNRGTHVQQQQQLTHCQYV
jgi:hypothetical protein